MRRVRTWWSALISMLMLASTPAIGADRALLIGIGHYGRLSPLRSLPGVDVDLAKMRQVADVMGFAPGTVRVLQDQDATVADIRAAIGTWLIDGTRPGDRALLYFSGHGSQVRDRGVQDEQDGLDEVLVGHDIRLDFVEGQLRASGVLADDDLFDLLDQLTGRNVLVLIDACSSGTATRGVAGSALPSDGWVWKSASLEGHASGVPDSRTSADGWSDRRGAQTWVTLSAADDDQTAIATSHGSLFTQALHDRLLEKRRSTSRIPVDTIRNGVAEYLTIRAPRTTDVPAPVLAVPVGAGDKGIQLVRPDARGPVRRQLESLVSSSGPGLLTAARREYRYGDDIRITVDLPQAGYLNVIAVDSNDRAYLLYPNRFNDDNRVRAGTSLELGNRLLGFELTAQEPAGETYVLAIFTAIDRPLNFYRETLAEYGEALGIERGLGKLSTTAVLAAKGIRVTAPAADYRAQGLIIQVRPPPDPRS